MRLFDRDIAEYTRHDVARIVAVVPQTQEVAFGFSVEDVVAMGRAPHQDAWLRMRKEDIEIIDHVLNECDLVMLRNKLVMELSFGEQRRVAIARALAQRPRVLLLDEPAAFLDVRHALDLYELLHTQAEEKRIACVVVMHDLNAAAAYATRVALMKDGRILAEGSVPDVMTYGRLREAFECDLYVGVNELTKDRYFVPMRAKKESSR